MKNTSSSINRALVRLAALLAAALMLAGCGEGDAKPAGSASPAPSATAAAPEPETGSAIKLPMPKEGAFGNPLLSATREMSSIYGLVFESLLTFDESGNIVPGLAETWSSEDGLTWTFKLRNGVVWHGTNKQTLTASDVRFTLDEVKALGKEKPWGYILDYLEEWKNNEDGTLTITFKSPFYGALHALTFPVLPASGGYNNGGEPAQPMGTGPYKVDSFKKGEFIHLSVNTDWWKKAPYITKIDVMPYPDNATEISSLVFHDLDAVQTDNLTVAQYRESGDAHVYEYPTRYFEFMALNFTSPDINNQLMRQAIAYAMDRREIVSYTYVNHAIVSDTPVPPDSWLYDGKLLKYNFNVAEARRLIMLTGWQDNLKADGTPGQDGYWDTSPDGVQRNLQFTLLANRDDNNTLRNDAAIQIKSQLEKAGIKVEIKADSWEQYTKMVAEKRFDLALCGCYLSPVPDYRYLLGTGGALNVGGYSNEEMDKLLEDIIKAPDSKSLKVKMSALQDSVINDLPIISLYFRTHTLMTTPGLNGVTGVREESAFAEISQWYFLK